jgi:hypothetical protein
MTKILKKIVDDHGYVTTADLPGLVKYHPELPLVIKWGCSQRTMHPARDVAEKIRFTEESGADYCREVFLSAIQLDSIREAMKIDS